jgi:hypothetical protein
VFWPFYFLFSFAYVNSFVIMMLSYYLSCTVQVGQLREVSNKAHNAELKLFLEVELGLVICKPIAVQCFFCVHNLLSIVSFIWRCLTCLMLLLLRV